MSILFVTGPALGHVGRALMVAEALREYRPGEIILAGNDPDGHMEKHVAPNGFRSISLGSDNTPLASIDFASRLEGAISEVDPDVLVLDISPTPWLLFARLPPIPTAYITNYFVTKVGGQTTVQDRAFEANGLEINKRRKTIGLPVLSNVRELYEKDLVILADPKEILPDADAVPANYRTAGAIWWEPECPLPEELKALDSILYISIGSTGSNVPDMIVEAVSKNIDIKQIITASVRPINFSTSTSVPIRHYSNLPGSKVLARSAFVITQGGAGSSYQALGAGVPMGFWPTHLNHSLLGNRLAELGTGILLNENTIDAEMRSFVRNRGEFVKKLEGFSYMNPSAAARAAARYVSELF